MVSSLVLQSHPVADGVAPSGELKVRQAAEQTDNLFTAIYAIVWRADLLSAAYEHAFDGVPFSNLTEAIPCTEFILGHGTTKSFAHSFPIGTVRLLEKFPHSDPPTQSEYTACRDWVKNLFKHEVWPLLEPALLLEQKTGAVRLVGTGGTTGP